MPSETMMTKTPTRAAKAQKAATLGVHLASPPEGRWEALPALEAYLFDDARTLLGHAPVTSGVVDIKAAIGNTRTVRAVIAPAGMHADAVLANAVLPAATYETATLEQITIGPGWWNTFLEGQFIRFYGNVERAMGENALPMAAGTIEVFEVDPYYWLQTRPDNELELFRDELIRFFYATGTIATAGATPAAAYAATAGAWPGTFAPGYDTTATAAQAAGAATYNGHAYANGSAASGGAAAYAGTTAPAFAANAEAPPFNPAIFANYAGATLRNFFIANQAWLRPYFCMVMQDWWFKLDKIGEVEVQPDGTFNGNVGWWRQGEARPDLYFRVRQRYGGETRYVYRPPIARSTWWNYAGQEVTIRVHNPEAICIDTPTQAIGNEVIFGGVGFDAFTETAHAPGILQDGENCGLYRRIDGRYAPYGGTLHFPLDIEPAGLRAAGAAFYRFSYRKGEWLEPEGAWTAITTPITRHYRTYRDMDGIEDPAYLSYPLTPAPNEFPTALHGEEGIFTIPDADLDYVITTPEDRAFAIWDTTRLAPEGTPQAEAAGVYTVRVEFFDESGADITDTIPYYRTNGCTPGAAYSYETVNAETPMFYVYIDNQPVFAAVNDTVQAGDTSTGEGYGFLMAGPEATIETGIRAYHPSGFLDHWRYTVRRGTHGETLYTHTCETNAGNRTTWYSAPDGTGTGHNVAAFFRGIPAAARTDELRRSTYEIAIEAYALTRNGYGVLNHFHATDTTAFALVETGGPVMEGYAGYPPAE